MLAPPRVSGGVSFSPIPFCVKGVVLHLLTTIAIPPHRLQPDQLMKIPKLILFDQVRFSGLNNSK